MPERFADLNTMTTNVLGLAPLKGVKYELADIERSGYIVSIDKLPPPAKRPPWIPPPPKRPTPE
jgi:hypothetical protein